MGKGKATAGFVLSIVGVVFGLLSGIFSIVGLPIAIVGLCLAVSGGKALKRNEQPTGIATAGLVLGIIAVVFTTIFFTKRNQFIDCKFYIFVFHTCPFEPPSGFVVHVLG